MCNCKKKFLNKLFICFLIIVLISIREFFARLGGTEGLLIVQSDSGDENATLIACARHLLLEQRVAAIEDQQEILGSNSVSPLHIVLVVQLPHVAGGCAKFVGFQGGKWLSVHIDELRPPSLQIPSVEFLVDRPISDLFDAERAASARTSLVKIDEEEVGAEQVGIASSLRHNVDIISLLRTCVQAAIARIDDNSSISRATNRIELMLGLLPENGSQHTGMPLVMV